MKETRIKEWKEAIRVGHIPVGFHKFDELPQDTTEYIIENHYFFIKD